MLIDLCEEIVRIYASNTDLIFLEYLFLSYKKNDLILYLKVCFLMFRKRYLFLKFLL